MKSLEAKDGDEEYMDAVDEEYEQIMEMYMDYFSGQKRTMQGDESLLFQAGRTKSEEEHFENNYIEIPSSCLTKNLPPN